MTLRSASLFLSTCLALAACDGGSDSGSGSGSTSGGDGSTSSDPTGVSISVSATTPTTDPSTTDITATATDTDGSTTDPTGNESSSSGGDGSSSSSSSTGEGDSSSSSTTGGEAGVTVYDVQDGTVAEGETVTIEGVVITGLRVGVGVFVQEVEGGEYSGVYVDTGDVDLTTFAVGDVVDLGGVTSEDIGVNGLAGLTAILADSFVATGDTMTLSPETVDLAVLADGEMAEPWEGVLVQVSGDLTATTYGDFFGQYAEFSVDTGGTFVLVDDFLYNIFAAANAADFPGFAEGATFTDVAGVLNFSFGNHKIAPRGAAELAGYVAPAG